MAELVYAGGLKLPDRKIMRVRIPLDPPVVASAAVKLMR